MPVGAIATPIKSCTGSSSQCNKVIKRKERKKKHIIYKDNMIMYVEYSKIIYKILEFIDTK